MTEAAEGIRRTIKAFISERFAAKTENLETNDPKYEKLAAQFDYDAWLADAARRVSQLQVVTHSLKPIHPDAKGSSLYAPSTELPATRAVGTHTLSEQFIVDVVGNAAALDVFKFLKLEQDGRTLLERVQQADPELEAALSDEPETARQLMQAFATITQPSGRHASHTRGKQLYWLIGDDPSVDEDFHLLAPLYATSLAHRVYLTINHDRFSDEAKAARDARRRNQSPPSGTTNYCDYPSLAVQRFGGSKPQNISQLNSERGGKSYLLGSAPPTWRSRSVSPIYASSALHAFGRRRRAVWQNVRELGRLLAADPDPNVETRNRRDELTAALIDELIVFTNEMHQLEPGWTDDWQCRLPLAHQVWLEMENPDWLTTICDDFSRWLAGQLERYWKLSMSDSEYRHWSRSASKDNAVREFNTELQKELDALGEVLSDE